MSGERADKGMTPSRLGPYRLGEVLEARAATLTFRAEHDKLGRRARVKVLRPTILVTSRFAQALEREAEVLAQLRSPIAPAVHDFVKTNEGMWMAIEEPGGHALSEIAARAGHLDAEVATAIALELATGLGQAHALGLVHHRVRPEIIELTAAGRVVVTDFSSARGAGSEESAEPFAPGELAEAKDPLAPEQLAGEDGDARADVFAVGVVAYALIAGEHPFGAPGPERGARLRSGHPPPLRDRAPGLSRELERVLLRCLARHPDDRFADGRELARALEAVLVASTRAPVRALVVRALAAAKLADAPREGREGGAAAAEERPASRAPSLAPVTVAFAALFGLVVAGGAVLQLAFPDTSRAATHEGGARGRGALRVLAHPWAEVVVDGEVVDTTPMARAIPLEAGRHYVTFRHPQAPDEKRTIDVAPGQTVQLDVTMSVVAPAPDAGPPAPPASASP